jgi:hypothetical protein
VLIAGGLIVAQNNRTQSAASNGFFFVRPLSTRDLATARLLAVLRSVGIGVGVIALVSALLLGPSLLFHGASLGMFIIACVLYAAFAFGLIWWGNVAAFGGLVAAVSLAVVGYIYAYHGVTGDWGFVENPPNDWHVWGWLGIMVLTLVGCVVHAHRRDLINRRATIAATAFWNLLLFLMLSKYFGLLPGSERFFGDPDLQPLSVAAAILGIAPFATVPLVMQWARHR